MKVQVVVVGAGACGLAAALAARDAGAEVLVLERDRAPSGSTSLSSGFVPAAGTRFQRSAGVADSPEKMFLEVGVPVKLGETPPLPTKAEIEKLLAVAPNYGVEIKVPGH